MTEQPFYPELARLSKFVQDCIDRTGLSINAYQKRYANQEPNRVVYTTLRTIARAQNRPDTPTLKKLAKVLSASEGREIAWGDLSALIDEPGRETDPELLKLMSQVDTSGVATERIGEAFKSLGFKDRLSLAPMILRQLADDIEFQTANDLQRAGLLIRREALRRGIGLGSLAEERNLPVEIFEQLSKGTTPDRFTRNQAIALSSVVRDINGDYGDIQFWEQFTTENRKAKR
jgi:hypothetical protein